MFRKFHEILTCGFWFLKYASGQTDKQTYRHVDRNTSPTYRDEVTDQVVPESKLVD